MGSLGACSSCSRRSNLINPLFRKRSIVFIVSKMPLKTYSRNPLKSYLCTRFGLNCVRFVFFFENFLLKDLFRLSPRLVVKRGEEGLVLPSPRKGEEGLWDCFIKESLVFADKYRASSWGELWREGVLKLEQQLGDVMVNVTAHHAVKDEEITLMTTNAKHVHPCEDSSRYFVLSPLETITKPENAAICSNCEKPDVVADYACKDCNENFCSECNDVLHRKKKLRAHVRKQISCVGVAFHSRIAANAFRECLASPEKINKFRSSVVIDSEKLTKSDTNLKEGSDSAQVAFVEKMMSLIAMLENEDMTAKAKKFFKDHLLQSNATVCPEMELVVRELVEGSCFVFCDVFCLDFSFSRCPREVQCDSRSIEIDPSTNCSSYGFSSKEHCVERHFHL